MKKESVKTTILLLLCAVGGLLIGFNAGQLTNWLNVALFVIGIGFVSMSLAFMGFFQAIWKRKS